MTVAAKDWGVPRVSSRAARSGAGVGREGSGGEMSTRFLASLGMTEVAVGMTEG
jgi:hypothetical protein